MDIFPRFISWIFKAKITFLIINTIRISSLKTQSLCGVGMFWNGDRLPDYGFTFHIDKI